MKVQFRRLNHIATIPMRAHDDDAGFDLTATHCDWDSNFRYWVCRTGIAVMIPKRYVGLLFPRSSIRDRGLHLANAVGVLDSGFTGEIVFSFFASTKPALYEPGDRIGQLVILPLLDIEMQEVNALPLTRRGLNGLGSTGK